MKLTYASLFLTLLTATAFADGPMPAPDIVTRPAPLVSTGCPPTASTKPPPARATHPSGNPPVTQQNQDEKLIPGTPMRRKPAPRPAPPPCA
jgi:hypothetical protein